MLLWWIAGTTIAAVLCAVAAVCLAHPTGRGHYAAWAFAAAACAFAFIDIFMIFSLIMGGK